MTLSLRPEIPGSLGKPLPAITSTLTLTVGSDMVLLSRIRIAQGLLDEALRFASKALSFRKECLGERLKVCDSLYQVATLLQKVEKTGLAV